MRNKWLIMFIFIIAVTLFLSVDLNKIEFNGNSENNYKNYYETFENGALDHTVGVVRDATNILTKITNTFNNIWNFILITTGNNKVNITPESIDNAQKDAIINNLVIVSKKQLFLIEYFNILTKGEYNQLIFIGKDKLEGSVVGELSDIEEQDFYQDFSFMRQANFISDYSITIYNNSNNVRGFFAKRDAFAPNTINLIAIPLNKTFSNDELYNFFNDYIQNDFAKTLANLNEEGINYWVINNVNENETGIIGEWVQNT